MPRRIVRWMDSLLSEDPFELFFVLLCFLAGIPLATRAAPSPSSLEAALPLLVVKLWGVTLSSGGFVSLCGILLRHPNPYRTTKKPRYIEGLLIEGGGLIALASAAAVIALAIITRTGLEALFGTATYFMFVAACAYRFITIKRTVAKMREAIELERKLQRGK